MNVESGKSMEPKKEVPLTEQCVCVLVIKPPPSPPTLAQDPSLSEPSDYLSIYQPTTSKHGQSVLFFNPGEIITTFNRATLC